MNERLMTEATVTCTIHKNTQNIVVYIKINVEEIQLIRHEKSQ